MSSTDVFDADLGYISLHDPDILSKSAEGDAELTDDSGGGDDDGLDDISEEVDCPSDRLEDAPPHSEPDTDQLFARNDYHIHASHAERKLSVEDLARYVADDDFDGQRAIAMLQYQYSLDYGRRRSGSRPLRETDTIYPLFYLDMLSVVGQPGRPISRKGHFFDNVTFTLRHWAAPYASKHVASSLPFALTHRTFRLATGAAQEIWFVVMHPRRRPAAAAPDGEPRRAEKHGQGGTALQRHHADVMAAYIKKILRTGELSSLGVEESWGLGRPQSKLVNYAQWVLFQTWFMDGWQEMAEEHGGYDDFWTENQPAFHCYDHGRNIHIEATEEIRRLPGPRRLRTWADDMSSSSGDDNDSGDDSSGDSRGGGGGQPDESPSYVEGSFERSEDLASPTTLDDHATRPTSPPYDSREPTPSATPSSGARIAGRGRPRPGRRHDQHDYRHRAPYQGGLEELREALEAKYSLANIQQVSYALAANLNASPKAEKDGGASASDPDDQYDPGLDPHTGSVRDGDSQGTAEPVPPPLCLLADRRQLDLQYDSPRLYQFYPMGFHPRFGNLQSDRPPRFLEPLCRLLCDNADQANHHPGSLSFGAFQGYTNIKRAIRNRPGDLLVTQGIATAALTLPVPESSRSSSSIQARHAGLLGRLRGEGTPENPAASTPFAREEGRLRNAIEQSELAFRFEQVVTLRVDRLDRDSRTFACVLQPIFELMLFFLRYRGAYGGVLRTFPTPAFPGVLCHYARIFGHALQEMDRRFREAGSRGLDVGTAEAIALLDRLGHHCFTGDPRVLPPRVLRGLQTLTSIRLTAWPYISPAVLDFRDPYTTTHLDARAWPRDAHGEPILLHMAALRHHYGPAVAANRRGQLWFAQLRHRGPEQYAAGAQELVRRLLLRLWVPETVRFMSHRLNRHASAGSRLATPARLPALRMVRARLAAWAETSEPFSIHAKPLNALPRTAEHRLRADVAAALYKACASDGDADLRAYAPTHATCLRILRSAIRQCPAEHVTEADWVRAIDTGLLLASIDWMPGTDRRRVTSQSLVLLISSRTERRATSLAYAPPHSRKRAAIEAAEDIRLLEHEDKHHKPALVVHMPVSVPFAQLPPLVAEGFARLQKTHGKGDQGVEQHYHFAHQVLRQHLQEPLCDLLLILVATVCSTSSSLHVDKMGGKFELDPRPKDNTIQSAVLATRMAWFLYPDEFYMPSTHPHLQGKRPVVPSALSVGEMAKKMGMHRRQIQNPIQT